MQLFPQTNSFEQYRMEAIMTKRILIVSFACLAILLTLTVSLGMAQQGMTGLTSEAGQSNESSFWIG
jgi:hypothetical protein